MYHYFAIPILNRIFGCLNNYRPLDDHASPSIFESPNLP